MIDSVRTVETPEGIQLELRPAGAVARSMAWALDMVIRITIYIAGGMVAAFFGRAGFGFLLILVFLLEWFYPVCFEVLWQGSTPGKRALGLQVLMEDGTPVGWGPSMLRSLMMFVDFLPAFYGTGLVAMLSNREGRRIGDMAAGTLVVHAPRQERFRPRAMPQGVTPLGAPFPLRLDEQRALVDFSDRLPTLTAERAEELAGLLEPLIGPGSPESVLRLQGMAAAIRGDRP